jgi:hypothetical protein
VLSQAPLFHTKKKAPAARCPKNILAEDLNVADQRQGGADTLDAVDDAHDHQDQNAELQNAEDADENDEE